MSTLDRGKNYTLKMYVDVKKDQNIGEEIKDLSCSFIVKGHRV